MERQLQENVYSFVAQSKVNSEILFGGDDKSGVIVNVRLRPWKNGTRQGVMILVASYDVDSALLLAVRAMNNARWVPLDWAARCITFGVYSPVTSSTPHPDQLPGATFDRKLFSSPDQDDTKDEETSAAYDGVGEPADENGELHPIKRVK